jgi:tRNA A37 threonylcarbamoyladenosine biosynthesis protein TsaE
MICLLYTIQTITHYTITSIVNYAKSIMTSTPMPKIVSVEGNIGVGKTTMLDNIENYIRKTELRILLLCASR